LKTRACRGTRFAGGSAALALLASFVVFLRHMADIKKEHHETIRKAHETICVQAGKHTEALERFATALETCRQHLRRDHAV
jgi:hypothetical protein